MPSSPPLGYTLPGKPCQGVRCLPRPRPGNPRIPGRAGRRGQTRPHSLPSTHQPVGAGPLRRSRSLRCTVWQEGRSPHRARCGNQSGQGRTGCTGHTRVRMRQSTETRPVRPRAQTRGTRSTRPRRNLCRPGPAAAAVVGEASGHHRLTYKKNGSSLLDTHTLGR